MIRFGVHCSLRKGLSGALYEAQQLGCESMQIFTRSPRMWKMRVPQKEEIDTFRELRKKFDIYPMVVHTPYLPNLASSNRKLYSLSKRSLEDDLIICGKLHADYLVIHPGAYSQFSTPETGISNIGTAINKVLRKIKGKTVLLLENVSGGGRRLGGSFLELAQMLAEIDEKSRVGICLDTAHALGWGYDFSNSGGIDRMLEEFDELVGMEHLKVIHFNDSIAGRGTKKDRHQHLGKGFIGKAGFKYLIKKVKNIAQAGILETPKDSETADKKNLSLLYKWRV